MSRTFQEIQRWWGKDSNLRRLAPSDLQSDLVGHLSTPPSLPTVKSAEADGRDRTGDLLITNQLLCQLSYVSELAASPVKARFRQDS